MFRRKRPDAWHVRESGYSHGSMVLPPTASLGLFLMETTSKVSGCCTAVIGGGST